MQEQHHTQLDVEHIFLAMLRQKKGLTSARLRGWASIPTKIAALVERELESRPRSYGQYGYGTRSISRRAPSAW